MTLVMTLAKRHQAVLPSLPGDSIPQSPFDLLPRSSLSTLSTQRPNTEPASSGGKLAAMVVICIWEKVTKPGVEPSPVVQRPRR